MRNAIIVSLAMLFASCASPMPKAKVGTHIFTKFIGEWTLENDEFQQVWDGETVETLTIANHHTKCDGLNTDYAIICVVSAGELKGQIYWTYDPTAQTLHHLSQFGETRIGIGSGKMDRAGNLKNKITFKDEPKGTYRIYEYDWVSADQYKMMSRQYDSNDQPTGNWYGGTFIRLKPS